VEDAAPEWMNIRNPLDIGPSVHYAKALSSLMEDPHIDMVLDITIIPYAVLSQFRHQGLTPSLWFGDIASIRKQARHKPLLVCAMGNKEFIEEMNKVAGPEVPVLSSPEMAARALGALWQYQRRRQQVENVTSGNSLAL